MDISFFVTEGVQLRHCWYFSVPSIVFFFFDLRLLRKYEIVWSTTMGSEIALCTWFTKVKCGGTSSRLFGKCFSTIRQVIVCGFHFFFCNWSSSEASVRLCGASYASHCCCYVLLPKMSCRCRKDICLLLTYVLVLEYQFIMCLSRSIEADNSFTFWKKAVWSWILGHWAAWNRKPWAGPCLSKVDERKADVVGLAECMPRIGDYSSRKRTKEQLHFLQNMFLTSADMCAATASWGVYRELLEDP